MIDTHAAFDKLTRVHFTDAQAEAIIAVVTSRHDDLATKTDLVQLNAALKTDLAQLKADLTADMAKLNIELISVMHRTAAMIIATVTLVVALLKLIH